MHELSYTQYTCYFCKEKTAKFTCDVTDTTQSDHPFGIVLCLKCLHDCVQAWYDLDKATWQIA